MKKKENNQTNQSTEQNDTRLHFSDYFQAPGARLLSVIFGLITGGIGGLFLGWQIGILIGAGVTLLWSILFPILLYRADIPYAKIKKTIQSKFLFDERVRFAIRGGRSVGGFFILTEKSMIFLSLERGTHRLELSREDIKSVVLAEDEYSLQIFLNDKQFILVVSSVCYEMYDVLRQNRWGVG
ncbi:MAG: hypothetical protein IJW16_01015 [Clostridia bacterium]|nr:hypothetical protein [Clostridia bacterium]